MQCLIVAAGQGSRLRSLAESKPLAEVAGRPLIEHVIRSAAEGGATSFVVATGYRAEPLEAWLKRFAAAADLPIRPARNPDWERPNGLSVLAAADLLEAEFLLAMSDHLFDPAIVRSLIAAPAAPLRLAIDHEHDSPLIDMDDATLVGLEESGRIVRIGKGLEEWDAVDTGLFRAGAALPEVIAESVRLGGQGSLSEGVQLLADRGEAFTLDVTGRWWLDVDDPRAFALAEAHFREKAESGPA
jgi:1L-myo-inositol 1-phosphate cytidylyltransferase